MIGHPATKGPAATAGPAVDRPNEHIKDRRFDWCVWRSGTAGEIVTKPVGVCGRLDRATERVLEAFAEIPAGTETRARISVVWETDAPDRRRVVAQAVREPGGREIVWSYPQQ
jgi:hypothetical protein